MSNPELMRKLSRVRHVGAVTQWPPLIKITRTILGRPRRDRPYMSVSRSLACEGGDPLVNLSLV